mgnify:FL=1
MKRKLALAALVAATLSVPAFAQGGPGMGAGPQADCPMQQGAGPGHGKGGMMGEGRHGMMGGRHGGMGGMGGMEGMGGPGLKALQALDLTPEQRTKVTEAIRDQQRKQHGFMGTMRELRWKQQDAQKGGFNEDAARKHFDAMAAIRKEMFEAHLATRKQIDGLLTPEQKAKLKDMRPGHGPGHGPGRGGPGPKA